MIDEAIARVKNAIAFEYFKLPKELRLAYLRQIKKQVDDMMGLNI